VTLWVLDTDHLSLLERGNVLVQGRLRRMAVDSVAITIVTAEENIKGRLATINSLSGIEKVDRLAVAYRTLQTTLDDPRNRRDFERVPKLQIEDWSL
jgi:tRNA(fMet)-specific endonuclease VapC